MSGRVASQTGYMLACPEPCTLLQVCAVRLYIVMCFAAERIHVPGEGWAGLDWGPGGNSAGVRSGTTGQMGPFSVQCRIHNMPMSILNERECTYCTY